MVPPYISLKIDWLNYDWLKEASAKADVGYNIIEQLHLILNCTDRIWWCTDRNVMFSLLDRIFVLIMIEFKKLYSYLFGTTL